MATIIRYAYDLNGDLLSGLSPTWDSYIDATTGEDLTPPAITNVTGNAYAAEVADGACGNIDFGPTALNRYAPVESRDVFTVPAFDLDGLPLTGLAPAWIQYHDAEGVQILPTPAGITELARGWYAAEPILSTAAIVQIDFGETANPRYVTVDTDQTAGSGGGDETAPVVANVSPTTGATLTTTTPVTFDVTDETALQRVILIARYAGRSIVEVVHDGDAFTPLYASGSTRTAITGGFNFSVLRNGGWHAAPRLTVYAVDGDGNEIS